MSDYAKEVDDLIDKVGEVLVGHQLQIVIPALASIIANAGIQAEINKKELATSVCLIIISAYEFVEPEDIKKLLH